MSIMRMSNYLLVVLFGLLVFLSLGCSANDGDQANNYGSIGTRESPVTPEQLIEVFQQGPEAVRKTYVGKTLIVCGKIQGIDGAPGQVICAVVVVSSSPSADART
jgi:hypothetical protein